MHILVSDEDTTRAKSTNQEIDTDDLSSWPRNLQILGIRMLGGALLSMSPCFDKKDWRSFTHRYWKPCHWCDDATHFGPVDGHPLPSLRRESDPGRQLGKQH